MAAKDILEPVAAKDILEPVAAKDNLEPGQTVKDRWTIIKKVGAGSYGKVYEALDSVTKEHVAMKLSNELYKRNLQLDLKVLKLLQGKDHICHFIESGQSEHFTYMVMNLHGKNLSEVRKMQHCFTLTTTICIGQQILSAIEVIHSVGFLHRDIKPSNIVIGRLHDTIRKVYMVDFGMAHAYCKSNGEVYAPREDVGFRGTDRYASINAHKGKELGRHDDLWSIFYSLVEFRVGHLPWGSLTEREEIGSRKEKYNHKELLKYMPQEFGDILSHIESLDYYAKPDYDKLQGLLQQCVQRLGLNVDDPFDWEKTSSDKSTDVAEATIQKSTHKNRVIKGKDKKTHLKGKLKKKGRRHGIQHNGDEKTMITEPIKEKPQCSRREGRKLEDDISARPRPWSFCTQLRNVFRCTQGEPQTKSSSSNKPNTNEKHSPQAEKEDTYLKEDADPINVKADSCVEMRNCQQDSDVNHESIDVHVHKSADHKEPQLDIVTPKPTQVEDTVQKHQDVCNAKDAKKGSCSCRRHVENERMNGEKETQGYNVLSRKSKNKGVPKDDKNVNFVEIQYNSADKSKGHNETNYSQLFSNNGKKDARKSTQNAQSDHYIDKSARSNAALTLASQFHNPIAGSGDEYYEADDSTETKDDLAIARTPSKSSRNHRKSRSSKIVRRHNVSIMPTLQHERRKAIGQNFAHDKGKNYSKNTELGLIPRDQKEIPDGVAPSGSITPAKPGARDKYHSVISVRDKIPKPKFRTASPRSTAKPSTSGKGLRSPTHSKSKSKNPRSHEKKSIPMQKRSKSARNKMYRMDKPRIDSINGNLPEEADVDPKPFCSAENGQNQLHHLPGSNNLQHDEQSTRATIDEFQVKQDSDILSAQCIGEINQEAPPVNTCDFDLMNAQVDNLNKSKNGDCGSKAGPNVEENIVGKKQPQCLHPKEPDVTHENLAPVPRPPQSDRKSSKSKAARDVRRRRYTGGMPSSSDSS